MRVFAVCFVTLVLSAGFAADSFAHRVNVFAFVDGDAVQVECSFSKSRKVRNGKLLFTDSETGAPLAEATTDENGLHRFRPDANVLKTGHGITILLIAGEGHQNEWRVPAEELRALSPLSPQAAPASKETPPAGRSPLTPATDQPAPLSPLSAAELEALVGRVVDAKLAPIKQTLARQENSGPALRDIIGGIGWIIGLLGLGTYMRYRR